MSDHMRRKEKAVETKREVGEGEREGKREGGRKGGREGKREEGW
jgi:hypothetical protein